MPVFTGSLCCCSDSVAFIAAERTDSVTSRGAEWAGKGDSGQSAAIGRIG